METTTPTAREQFVSDYTLVVDNTVGAWLGHISKAKNGSVAVVSEKLQEDFETTITQICDIARAAGLTTGADLVSQMLIGWGADTFDSIARHYIYAADEVK